MALGLEWAGEGREVVRRPVRDTGQPLVVEVEHYLVWQRTSSTMKLLIMMVDGYSSD